MAQKHETVKFLLVDDDVVSIMALQRTIKKLKLLNPVKVAKDGVEALEILRGEAGHSELLPPYIITLDLSMPRMGGHEFLEVVRADPALRRVVVFVLTTSDAREDIDLAYEKNVAGYVLKDDAEDSFRKAIDMLNDYCRLIVLPS